MDYGEGSVGRDLEGSGSASLTGDDMAHTHSEGGGAGEKTKTTATPERAMLVVVVHRRPYYLTILSTE